MCGIIGCIGSKDTPKIIYNGLKRLEYRGYDSAGAAFVSGNAVTVIKKEGRVEKLAPFISETNADIGIGHTRWATHGLPSDVNAHPHSAGGIAIVHNGIIENYAELKAGLIKEGAEFLSETDSEVCAHLVNKFYKGDLLEALIRAAELLKGTYALMAICAGEQKIVVAANKSPLVIGYGNGENFCASDEYALAGVCPEITVLRDGDFACITATDVEIYDSDMQAVIREREPNLSVSQNDGLGNCPHYMLKELHECAQTVQRTCEVFPECEERLEAALDGVTRVILIGCGTAYHAALVGKRYIESFAKIPAEVETAGEFRYKNPVLTNGTAVFAISQSGETADTLQAAELALSAGAKVVAVTNSLRSRLTRLATVTVPVAAGKEVCVAATKSYSGQIAALYLSALVLSGEGLKGERAASVLKMPALMKCTVENLDIRSLASMCASSRGVYFLGKDLDYAVALEGSLKLKEISYIPGEGYPSGEFKHGTLALIDETTTSVFIICDGELAEKSENAVEQALSRGGKAAVFTNVEGVKRRLSGKLQVISLPECNKFLSPLLSALAVQLLAYRTAVTLKRDPDKPRNLAKSVTVE